MQPTHHSRSRDRRVAARRARRLGGALALLAGIVVGAVGGTASAASPPGAPAFPKGNNGDGQVSLTWSPPAADGGSPITDYEVRVYGYLGGAAAGVTGGSVRLVGSAATSYTFTGLTNGVTYRFRVAAVNAAGTGALSALSAGVVAGAPAAPTNVRVAPGATSSATGPLIVSFTPGADNGSSATSFTARCASSTGGTAGSASAATSPVTVDGLTTGKAYTCNVSGTNGRGAGVARVAAPMTVGAPGQPTFVSVIPLTADDSTGPLHVTGLAAVNSPSPETVFTAACTSANGGVAGSAQATRPQVDVPALTTAKTYRCTLTARNALGTGPTSLATAAVIVGSPRPPVSLYVEQTSPGTLGVHPSISDNTNNGSPISGYRATCTSSDGGVSGSGSASRAVLVSGLTAGKTYTCRATAVNARGPGVPSKPSSPVVA
ncbi:MAG: fibronectin [Acidimicrobiales bacterium]|nr:fibronectin [Acidimicrobiales bacterium]